MLVFNKKIDIDSNLIHCLDIDFLKTFYKFDLIDMLLQWVKSKIQTLVFTDDWTPKIQYLVHRILFESSQTHNLLDTVWLPLQQLLRVVRLCEKFWDFWSTPDDMDIFRWVLVITVVQTLQVRKVLHSSLELSCF